ncbi:MAG: CBS domain-containing protein [Candidatus Aenigmatarchaeota archaeon]
MLVEFAEKAALFKPDDSIAKVESTMLSKRIDCAVVANGGYRGIIWARDFGKKKIPEPDKTKIEKYVRPIKPFSDSTPLDDLLTAVVTNDWPAVPIEKEGQYYILGKTGMLQTIKKNVAGIKLTEVMAVPFSIRSDDSIATAMATLRDTGVSRLVVVDKNGRFDGIVDIIDLLGANIQKDRAKFGEVIGESIKLEQVSISRFVRKNIPTLSQNSTVKEAIDAMVKSKVPVCVVLDGERPIGIVTPKPILRLAIKKLVGVWVQLSGIQPLDPFLKAVVDEQITKAIQKWSKFVPITQFHAHFDRYDTEGKRQKWSIKAKLVSQKKIFYADDHAWDVTKAMRGILTKFEKELLQFKERAEARPLTPERP